MTTMGRWGGATMLWAAALWAAAALAQTAGSGAPPAGPAAAPAAASPAVAPPAAPSDTATTLLRPDIPTDVSAYMVPPPMLLQMTDFRDAYFKAIGPLKRLPWLRELPGTEPARAVDYAGRRYVLVQACNPRDCQRHRVTLLFDPRGPSVAGVVQDGLRRTPIGRRDHPARGYFPQEVTR